MLVTLFSHFHAFALQTSDREWSPLESPLRRLQNLSTCIMPRTEVTLTAVDKAEPVMNLSENIVLVYLIHPGSSLPGGKGSSRI